MDPALIRHIVDETAEFVAKHGSDFERRFIADDTRRQKAMFSFLVSSDPYHAYYQQRLSEFRAQNQSEPNRAEHEELNKPKPNSAPTSVPTHNWTVGIIYSPEDIRNFVDKVAQSVAKYGSEFKKRLIALTSGNAKFNFLVSSDPYHAYYQQRCSEFHTQNQDEHEELNKPNSAPTSVPTIGIRYPPEDIRYIADKTAQFVAKNGPEFEKRIIANNTGNAMFSFLVSSDPCHAYYQHRLSEFCAQN